MFFFLVKAFATILSTVTGVEPWIFNLLIIVRYVFYYIFMAASHLLLICLRLVDFHSFTGCFKNNFRNLTDGLLTPKEDKASTQTYVHKYVISPMVRTFARLQFFGFLSLGSLETIDLPCRHLWRRFSIYLCLPKLIFSTLAHGLTMSNECFITYFRSEGILDILLYGLLFPKFVIVYKHLVFFKQPYYVAIYEYVGIQTILVVYILNL